MIADCPGVHRARTRGEPLTPAQLAHQVECPLCAELADAPVGVEPGRGSLADRVLAETASAQPIGARMSTPLRVALVACLAVGVICVVLMARTPAFPSAGTLGPVALLAVAGALVAGVALRPIHRPPPAWTSLRTASALVLPLLATAWTGWAAPLWQGAEMTTGCLAIGSVAAALVVAALLWTERRRRPSLQWTLGVAALAGVTGTIALDLSCTSGGLVHRALGHALVGALAALALTVGFAVRRGRAPASDV